MANTELEADTIDRIGLASKENKDVTSQVEFGNNDDECLPITKCVCGAVFMPWEFIISIYSDDAYECPKCQRKFYFSCSIRIYQVTQS